MSLYSLVPQPPVLLFESWQADLLADDLAWLAGVAELPLGQEAAPPRRLHRLWRRILDGELTPESTEIRHLELAPQLATARMLGKVGRDRLAQRQLEAMRDQFGDRAAILILLGSTLGNRGAESIGQAEALFRRATEVEPSNAEAFVRLGIALAKQQRFAEARAAWQQARRLDPSRHEVGNLLRQLPPP